MKFESRMGNRELDYWWILLRSIHEKYLEDTACSLIVSKIPTRIKNFENILQNISFNRKLLLQIKSSFEYGARTNWLN